MSAAQQPRQGQAPTAGDSGGPGGRQGHQSLSRLSTAEVLLALALLAALAIFLGVVNQHYPIGHWLIWRYLGYWVLALGWAASCLAFGHVLLDRLGVRIGQASTEAALAFPLGVFAFQWAMFVLGLGHLLGWVTFLALPAAFFYAGRRRLVDTFHLLAGAAPPSTFGGLLVALFGVAGAALVYFQILTPEAFSWDARWYHLQLAQQYALQGSVSRFPEGWWLAGYPQGASLLYTWAFSLPGVLLFDRLELSAHLEFVVFLATIASIPALVHELVPRVRGRGAWAAMFLFPGIFLYDGNLCAGADHVAALWCVPVVLALLRLWENWRWREGVLFGALMAAGISSKLSTWSMLVFPGLLFLVRAAWMAAARRARRAIPGAAALPPFLMAGLAMLGLSAHYWLRNWIWYGDPLYPALHEHLHSRPWSAEASASYRVFKSLAFSPASGLEGLKDALAATLTFSFKPNDWASFHRNVPVLGSLFTLTMLCLPMVRPGRRLWLAYIGVLVALVVWYLTTHQDRYLQTWMPCIVGCTAATLALVWQTRRGLLRVLVGALVGAQILWGGDVPFFPTHNLLNDSPIRVVSNFLASGFLKTPNRFRLYGDEGLVAEHLPPGSTLLVHESNLQVGFGTRTVNDQWQGRLSYATLASPAAIYDELASMKVTHLGWQQSMSGWNSVGHDLAFMGFALNHARAPSAFGIYTVGGFPVARPSAAFNDRVAMLTCGNPYARGVYGIAHLIVPEPGQPWARPEAPLADNDLGAAVREAGFLVVEPGCTPNLPAEVAVQFHSPISRGSWRLYMRRQ